MDALFICLRRNPSLSLPNASGESLICRVICVLSRRLLWKHHSRKWSSSRLIPTTWAACSLRTQIKTRKWNMMARPSSDLSFKLLINFEVMKHMHNAVVNFLHIHFPNRLRDQFIIRSLLSLQHVFDSPLLPNALQHWENKFDRIVHRWIWRSKDRCYVQLIIELHHVLPLMYSQIVHI